MLKALVYRTELNNLLQGSLHMTLPLLYTNPVPLEINRHAGLSLTTRPGAGFVSTITAVPVALSELQQVIRHYPVAFAMDSSAMPLAILGLRKDENLFVDKDGNWLKDTYIPAYIRRYPFVFANNEKDNLLTLCLDEVEGVLEKSDKFPLFDKDNKPSPLVQNALAFCTNYQRDLEITRNFTTMLDKSEILVNSRASIKLPNETSKSVTGLRLIDKRKYDAFSDAAILEWHRNQWSSVVFAHLQSMVNWQTLTKLLEERVARENTTKESVKSASSKPNKKSKGKKSK